VQSRQLNQVWQREEKRQALCSSAFIKIGLVQRHVGRGVEETGLAQSNMYRDSPGTVPRKADGGDDTGLVQRHVLNYVPYLDGFNDGLIKMP
jgi:hypothetical protein